MEQAILDQLYRRITNAPDTATVWQIALDGLWALTEKSIAKVTRRFRADLRNLVTVGFISSSSILADMRRLVKDAVADAYIEGLAQGGVPVDEMSDDDALMIVELSTTQLDYVTDFVRAIRQAKDDKAAQRDILNRVDLWTASVESAGAQGLASAKSNTMGTWRLGKTEEHCKTCQSLNGKSHRLKWYIEKGYIPRQPGNEQLECGGWQCDCEIVDSSGKRLV